MLRIHHKNVRAIFEKCCFARKCVCSEDDCDSTRRDEASTGTGSDRVSRFHPVRARGREPVATATARPPPSSWPI